MTTGNCTLLTGATGFLGTQIAREILKRSDQPLLVLVRAKDRETAGRKLRRAWWEWPDLTGALQGQVEIVCGDVSEERLGCPPEEYRALVSQVHTIIHAASDVRLNAPIAELRRTNVQGVANVLALARAVHYDHGLGRLSHISTAYVAGGRTGRIPEEALSEAFGFSSSYELSKWEGEQLVHAAGRELPVSIFRPGMIVGDSQTGYVKTFNTLYFPIRLFLQGKLRVIPGDPRLRLNIVPVDYVARSIVQLTFNPDVPDRVFHLTLPYDSLPTAGELVEFGREWAVKRLQMKFPRPVFVPLPLPRGRYRSERARRRNRQGDPADLLSLLPYFNERLVFERGNVDRWLGTSSLDWRETIPRLLEFAVSKGFLHRSARTVPEQIVFRLGSQSRPIRLYDVSSGEILAREPLEARRQMLVAAGALRSLGVCPGDRIALIGKQNTRRLILEVAIGLAGAVQVPISGTSSPAHLDMVWKASGPKLAFAGQLELLPILSGLYSGIPIISFTPGAPPELPSQAVMGWEEFLSLGEAVDPHEPSPAGFDDPALLSFSHEPSGQLKCVPIDHRHVRSMGESIAERLPWRILSSPAVCLSYSPETRSDEDILARYAPFYLPAPVTIFYLEDIRDLPKVLSKVKPGWLSRRLTRWGWMRGAGQRTGFVIAPALIDEFASRTSLEAGVQIYPID